METLHKRNEPGKSLRLYGILLLILAGLDAIILVIDLFFTDLHAQAQAFGSAGPVILIFVIVLCLAVLAVKIWMGIQALRSARGVPVTRHHITVAKIAMVLFFLMILIPLLKRMTGAPMDTDMANHVVSFFTLAGYTQAAQSCLEQQNK